MNKKIFTLSKALAASLALLAPLAGNAQYCTSGMYDNLGCTGDEIESFSTTGGSTNITNPNTGCSGTPDNYIYYAGMTHTATHGSTVNFSITNNPVFGEYYKIWVDWNADGDYDDAGEEVYNGGLQNGGATFTGSFTVPAGASVGATRLRVRSGFSPLAGACDIVNFGEAEEYDFFVEPSTADNSVPGKLVAPVNFCQGTYPVQVIIKNNGTNVINNVDISWTLDGVPQGTINYNTPIPVVTTTPGSNEATVTLGNVAFVSPNLGHTIVVTVTNPNGNTNNAAAGTNVATYTPGAGLNGTYTVGGTSPNFATVVDAVNYLNAHGVCGPVTMNIRPGTYTGRVRLNSVSGASQANRIRFQSENGNAATVVIQDATTATAATNYVFSLNNAPDVTIKNVTISATGTSGSGKALEFIGDVSRDSIDGNTINIASTANWDAYGIYGDDVDGENNVFVNNTVNGGDYSMVLTSFNFMGNTVIEHNTFLEAFAQTVYVYNQSGLKFNANEVSTTGTASVFLNSYHNGPTLDFCSDIEVRNNRIKLLNGGYGLMLFSPYSTTSDRCMVVNNEIAVGGNSNSGGYGIYEDGGVDINFYNNSVHISATTTDAAAGRFGWGDNENIYNNVFANTGDGFSMYFPSATSSTIQCDYNNIYTTGVSLVGTDNGTFDSLSEWRINIGRDRNSISYDPGFAGSFNLTPDASNAASWSLNGRGIQIAGNDKDRNGNNRVTDITNGVPDIGAYEFTPNVLPPLATAIPATPVAGSDQVFLFGRDTVAKIHWDATMPVPQTVMVKQYTGTVPPQFPVANYMYFYTDINVLNSTYNVDADVYYKDPWMGKISQEAVLKTAKKETAGARWVAYNEESNAVNAGRNILTGARYTSLGYFTGIEKDSLFSAYIKPNGSTVFCTGGSVMLNANFKQGYTYQWKLNGANIPGANNPTYLASTGGIYRVDISYNNQVAQSMEIAVTIAASPNTNVSLSGPRRICPGSSVVLKAQTANGQEYQWQHNGVDIAGATADQYTASVGGNFTVRIKNVGCSGLSAPVTIVQGPVLVDLGTDTSFCELKPLLLDAQNDGATYRWSTGDTSKTIAITSTSGKYWVEVNAGPNCFSSDTIMVNINPMPSVVGISYVKAGNKYVFTPGGIKNADNWLWVLGDGTTDTSYTITHEYSGALQNMMLIVYNGCGSDTAYLSLPLGINTTDTKDVYTLYPNPAQKNITLSVSGNTYFSNTIIVNSIGQVVYRDMDNSSTQKRTYNVEGLIDGYYIIRVNTSDGNVISKPFRIMR